MKGNEMLRLTVVIALFTAMLFSCEKSASLSEAEMQYAREKGQQYAQKLMVQLKDTLQAAIRDKGLVGAVEVCNLKALPLTRAVESDGISLKRVATRLRNPRNAPDRHESEALAYFEETYTQTGLLPDSYVQVVTEGGQRYALYYQPLKVQGLCLSCHGSTESMPDDLKNKLRELYPDDQAVNYGDGSFRGAIRVKMPLPPS
jgi:hypothetical protein